MDPGFDCVAQNLLFFYNNLPPFVLLIGVSGLVLLPINKIYIEGFQLKDVKALSARLITAANHKTHYSAIA